MLYLFCTDYFFQCACVCTCMYNVLEVFCSLLHLYCFHFTVLNVFLVSLPLPFPSLSSSPSPSPLLLSLPSLLFSFLLPSQSKLVVPDTTYIFNHIQFLIWYHKKSEHDNRIVKASVALASCEDNTCSNPMKISSGSKGKYDIKYSYTVLFMVQ